MSSASQGSDGHQQPGRPPAAAYNLNPSIHSTQSSTWSETFEPLDYEDVINEHATANDRDPLKLLLSFPLDDLQIYLLPRPCRTVLPVTPPEPL